MSVQLDALRRHVGSSPAFSFGDGGQVVLVGSGKGGVGTSTVAAMLAVMAAADGRDVLLVDADESHGALPLLLGVEPRLPFARLRGGEAAPDNLLVPLGHGLALLPAGGPVDPAERLGPADRRVLMRRVSALFPRFELVVIDAGSRLEAAVTAAALGITRFLAVTTPERIAAAATYALVKTLDARVEGLPVDLLFNRCRVTAATAAFAEVERATRRFLDRPLAFAGAVPDDDRLRALADAGTPLQEAAAMGTPAAAACHELAVRIGGRQSERDAPFRRPAQGHTHAVLAPRLSPRR